MGKESADRNRVDLSENLIARLDGLTEQELREVVHYAQRRLREVHQPVSDRIEVGPGEELVSIEERPEYTEVIKREPCGEDCSDCPHGPHLYHVYEERYPDRSSSLHWVFLGRVFERPSENGPA